MPSAYLQWRFHSGEQVVAHVPLVLFRVLSPLLFFVNNIRSSGIRICQGFVVRGFQTVSLFVKDEVFLQVPCTLCVRGFYGLGIGRFLHVQSVCWRFWYQRFLQILYVVVVVLWVYSLSDGFFRFSVFVKVLGVRTLLCVLWFGVSEVSRFKCRKVSSGLFFQFERFGYQMILRFS